MTLLPPEKSRRSVHRSCTTITESVPVTSSIARSNVVRGRAGNVSPAVEDAALCETSVPPGLIAYTLRRTTSGEIDMGTGARRVLSYSTSSNVPVRTSPLRR